MCSQLLSIQMRSFSTVVFYTQSIKFGVYGGFGWPGPFPASVYSRRRIEPSKRYCGWVGEDLARPRPVRGLASRGSLFVSLSALLALLAFYVIVFFSFLSFSAAFTRSVSVSSFSLYFNFPLVFPPLYFALHFPLISSSLSHPPTPFPPFPPSLSSSSYSPSTLHPLTPSFSSPLPPSPPSLSNPFFPSSLPPSSLPLSPHPLPPCLLVLSRLMTFRQAFNTA